MAARRREVSCQASPRLDPDGGASKVRDDRVEAERRAVAAGRRAAALLRRHAERQKAVVSRKDR